MKYTNIKKGIFVSRPNRFIAYVNIDGKDEVCHVKNTEYIKGVFSVREPKEKILCPKEDIDTVVVPGIAFDKKGNRMGFGKGCYDMFLEDFNGVKVGMCYDFQLADDLPHSEYDIAMDYIFSDKIIIDCQ